MNKKELDMLKQPEIYLTTRTSVDWIQVAEFLADQGVPPIPDSIRAGKDESAAVVEISARMCYMSYGRGRKDIADFINNLLYRKDGSVLEHVNFGFVITGISRSLTHELIRHRAGFAYSQRSQRYVDESGASFVIPPALVNETFSNDKVNELFNKAMENAATSYEELVKDLKGMKFFIVRWCGDVDSPSSHNVDNPIKFFDEYHYGDDVVKDLKEMAVGEKYNVDEMMQDIEILRYE